MTLQEAYPILKENARYSSSVCDGFVYLSQIRELLEVKPKYNQSLIDKVHNREAVIEVDDFTIIKDLINFMYPDDPYLEDKSESRRVTYYSSRDAPKEAINHYGKKYWGCDLSIGDMADKPRIKASEFLL